MISRVLAGRTVSYTSAESSSSVSARLSGERAIVVVLRLPPPHPGSPWKISGRPVQSMSIGTPSSTTR